MPHGYKPGTLMTRFINVVAQCDDGYTIELGNLTGGGQTVNDAWHELCDRIRRDLHKYDVNEITHDDWRAA